MNNKLYIIPMLLGIALLAGIILYPSPGANKVRGDEIEVTVFKSPNCGCCVQHSAYLERNGFDVTIVETNEMASIKADHNIPHNMQSCHTAVIGDYFVEGHMPVEAINKLLEEKPAIEGITLPGMPSGSPGMPGPQLDPFVIYRLENGQGQIFTTL